MAEQDQVLAVLREARRLIAEVGWTQWAFARDVDSIEVSPKNPKACCFCLFGAVIRANSNLGFPARVRAAVDQALDSAVGPTHSNHVIFNDHARTKEDVLAVLDKAIAQRESEVTA